MEAQKKYELGDLIDIYCRYCKLNLNGVVSAVVNNKVVKVMCRTCKTFQDYKPPIDERVKRRQIIDRVLAKRDTKTKATKPATTQDPLSQEAVARRLWDEATKDVNPLKSRLYYPWEEYQKDEVLTHPEYGLGVVTASANDHILVLFRDGFKRLEHKQPRPQEEEE